MTPQRRKCFLTLADDLTMLASQIREAANDQGDLPSPWRIDDWLANYNTEKEVQAKRLERKKEHSSLSGWEIQVS